MIGEIMQNEIKKKKKIHFIFIGNCMIYIVHKKPSYMYGTVWFEIPLNILYQQ